MAPVPRLQAVAMAVVMVTAVAAGGGGEGHSHGHSHGHGHGHGELSQEFQELIDANWTERMLNAEVKFIQFENEMTGFDEDPLKCALSAPSMSTTGQCVSRRPGFLSWGGANGDPCLAEQAPKQTAEGQCSCQLLNTIMAYLGLASHDRSEHFTQPLPRCCGARRRLKDDETPQFEDDGDGKKPTDAEEDPLAYDPADLEDPALMSTEDILRGLRQGSSNEDMSTWTLFVGFAE